LDFHHFSPILDVHQTLPLPHKTLRYSSSSFIYVTNIHFINSGMTSLEFGPHSLKTWSWKPKRPWAYKSFTNYKLHYFIFLICDFLVILAWKLVSYCLIFILSNFRVHCFTLQIWIWYWNLFVDFESHHVCTLISFGCWALDMAICFKFQNLCLEVIKFVGVIYTRSWVNWNAFVVCVDCCNLLIIVF